MTYCFDCAQLHKTCPFHEFEAQHGEALMEIQDTANTVLNGRSVIVVDRDIRGGQPVLFGHQIPVSILLAKIAEKGSLKKVADSYDLTLKELRALVYEVASKPEFMSANDRHEYRKKAEQVFKQRLKRHKKNKPRKVKA
jgi:uncharacterized protein (DUF433 family)